MGSAAVQNVSIVCSAIMRTVGGTVSGLTGTIQLQDNGADTLSLSTDGAFAFATPVAQGGACAVTVLTQPAAQTCMVTNGSGTAGAASVTNIGVICVANQSTLSVAATGTIPVKMLFMTIAGLLTGCRRFPGNRPPLCPPLESGLLK